MPTVTEIKSAVRARDGFKCVQCGMTDEQHRAIYRKTLDVHRVVPGSLYTVEGSITSCRKCHARLPKMARGQIDQQYGPRIHALLKLPAALHHKAKMIATYRGFDLSEYLSSLLDKLVERDYQQMLKSMNREDAAGREDADD